MKKQESLLTMSQGVPLESAISKDSWQGIFLLLVLLCSVLTASAYLQASTFIQSSGQIYYQPEAKVLLRDGFESKDFVAWNGTYTTLGDNATVAPTNPYEGAYHGLFQTGVVTSGARFAYCYRDLQPTISEIYVRGYFQVGGGLPLNNDGDRFGLIGFEVGGQLQSTFRVLHSGMVDTFSIVGFNGSNVVSSSTDSIYPVNGRWYCIEFFIRVHDTMGEYRAWINGVEQITITNLNTTIYGSGASRVRFGLTYTANLQHNLEVYGDCAEISTRYVGPLRYTFGIMGSDDTNPAIRNFYWLFGNQTISFKTVLPSEVTSFADVDRFDGLVVWTKQGSYNVTAIKQYAQTHVVIVDVWDFCSILYSSLGSSIQVVNTSTVTYALDWGNFRSGDLVEMRNETGSTNRLTTVLSSGLSGFSNITVIARYDASRIAFFHMNGTQSRSGFYVMDLDATTPSTEWTGIWHLFPAVKIVQDFPTGKYARWIANGQSWWNLTWVYNYIDTIVNGNQDIAAKSIIGKSVQGRNLTAIVIGKGQKNIILDGDIHGNEKAGTFACLRVAELLIEYYRSDSWWHSKLLTSWRIIIIPTINPDGFSAYTRENANGKDLNRQFPPEVNTTEPEAWALRNLMGNYTPTVYISLHEGYSWYPNVMLYGNYEKDPNRTVTINTMKQANDTFASLKHWGWFTENNASGIWIGKVQSIMQGGYNSMSIAYASSQYNASCMLLETLLWSSAYNPLDGRLVLYAMDLYPAVILGFIENNTRLN